MYHCIFVWNILFIDQSQCYDYVENGFWIYVNVYFLKELFYDCISVNLIKEDEDPGFSSWVHQEFSFMYYIVSEPFSIWKYCKNMGNKREKRRNRVSWPMYIFLTVIC